MISARIVISFDSGKEAKDNLEIVKQIFTKHSIHIEIPKYNTEEECYNFRPGTKLTWVITQHN